MTTANRRSVTQAVLAVTLGICVFSLMDATMKAASIEVGAYSAVLLRNALGCVLMIPVWLIQRRAWPRREVLRIHALRSAVVAGMAVLFFWGLVRVPMAEAIALSFISPLIALYLAAVLLGERIRPSAIFASVCGIVGVAVIALARWHEGTSQPASLAGIAAILASALLYAWNLVIQRQQAMVAGPVEVALFQNMLVGLFLLPAAPWLLVLPGLQGVGHIAAGSLLTITALMLLTWGYARAEAQVLLPIEYTAFVWAALFGWWWFGEHVSAATIAGAALILAGCWLAARRGDRDRPEATSAP